MSEGFWVRDSAVGYLVELVYDGVEGSTYVIGAQTAMFSRTLSSDFKTMWRDS